eukprot:2535332-Rhodomonas_salina.6
MGVGGNELVGDGDALNDLWAAHAASGTRRTSPLSGQRASPAQTSEGWGVGLRGQGRDRGRREG